MTSEQLQAIRERVNKATPGPWKYEREEDNEGIDRYIMDGVGDYVTELKGLVDESDAEFIALAREDLPNALDHIAQLTDDLHAEIEKSFWQAKEIERLRGVVRGIRAEAMTAYESDDEDVRVSGGALLFQLRQKNVWIQRGHANDDVIFEDELAGESI